MNYRISMLLIDVPILLVIFLLGVITPNLTRKELFFGIRIPEDEIDSPDLRKLGRLYFKMYILTGILYLTALIILYFIFPNEFIIAASIIGLIIHSTLVYYYIHRKVYMLKKAKGWESSKREVLVVDTGFRGNRNEKVLVSPWWFAVPVFIIIVNVIIGLASYENMPQKVPVHWNSLNQVDRWAEKSYRLIFQMPIMELFMTGFMFIVYKAIGWAKQQINASYPGASSKRSRLFRLRWSGYTIFINTLILIIYTNINLVYLGILKPDGKVMWAVNTLFPLIILVSTVILAVSTGQGGSRIKFNDEIKGTGNFTDRNDDRYWKWGMIYFNPKDPAIFIEKRFGVGWTINFGRPGAFIAIACLIASIILIQFIIRLLS